MINYVTVHYKSNKWIDLQYEFIRRYTNDSFRIYTWMDEVQYKEENYYFLIDNSEKKYREHGLRLDYLSRMVFKEYKPEDIIIFIDGDAIPIKSFISEIMSMLDNFDIVCVQRPENFEEFTHPSFCAVKVSTWEEYVDKYNISWQRPVDKEGKFLRRSCGLIKDTGYKVYEVIEENNISWYKLLRSNGVDIHPLYFGIYGDIVYHHGAGFRLPTSHRDREDLDYKENKEFIDKLNLRFSNFVYNMIKEDKTKMINYLRSRGKNYG